MSEWPAAVLEYLRKGTAVLPLWPLPPGGAFTLFSRVGETFELLERQGYEREHYYDFLERPEVWSQALVRGAAQIQGEAQFYSDTELWVILDQPGEPDFLMVLEIPREVSRDLLREESRGDILRLLLLAGISRRRPAAPSNPAILDLPIWLLPVVEQMDARGRPLLLISESGSGREELIRVWLERTFGSTLDGIFFHPGRLPAAIQEREIFGDSRRRTPGAGVPFVERAEPAVIIQEVGDLARSTQLQFLGLFTGGETSQAWILETSRELEGMVADGLFEPGLLRILEENRIVLPSVRSCQAELPAEVERLMGKFRKLHLRELELSADALELILEYDWPGNWRELKNTLESAFLMCSSDRIRAGDLRPGAWRQVDEGDDLNLRRRTQELEKSLLIRAHGLHNGNQVQMARALGISRGSLQYKLEKYTLGRLSQERVPTEDTGQGQSNPGTE